MNQSLLSHVLPTGSLLWKDCQDSWEFFLSEEDWESESSYASQNVNETFEDFIIRIIEKLIADKHEEVAINYAIHRNHEE